MTTDLLTLLGVAAPLATMMSLWILAQISRRFGEVTQRPPLYRGFYAALALWVFPLVTRLLAMGVDERLAFIATLPEPAFQPTR